MGNSGIRSTRRRATLAISAALVVSALAGGANATTALAQSPASHTASAPQHAAPSYRVTSAALATGLYQSAYSQRHDDLWVTAAAGTTSQLLRVNPRTLQVEKSLTPPVTDPATGAVEAVYGVAVDDRHDTVWTTNTRDNSVAVYSQRTGRHLATFPGVKHSREVVVDEARNRAYATALADGSVVVFDTRTLKEVRRVHVEGSSPAGLALDRRTGTVYATDLSKERLIVVSAKASVEPRLIPVAGGSLLDVALDRTGRTAYVADLKNGRVSVVDLRTGTTERTIDTGAGTISVATDPRSGLLYVSSQTSGTTKVVDPRTGATVAEVATGARTNHVTVTARGVFAVDKSSARGSGDPDWIHRITFGR